MQAGGWLRAVGERVGAHALTQVMRQRNADERAALARLHAGDPDAYLGWADAQRPHRRAHQTAARTPRRSPTGASAVDEHGPARRGPHRPPPRGPRGLNDAARALQRDSGALGPDVDYDTVAIAVGDRVICRRNDSAVDVDNGTRGTVRATHPDRIVLETDAGTVPRAARATTSPSTSSTPTA